MGSAVYTPCHGRRIARNADARPPPRAAVGPRAPGLRRPGGNGPRAPAARPPAAFPAAAGPAPGVPRDGRRPRPRPTLKQLIGFGGTYTVDRRIQIAAVAGAVAFSALVLTSPSDPLPLPKPTAGTPASESVAVLATNLDQPRAVAVSGDGRVFVAEKGGAIRVVAPAGNGTALPLDAPLAVLRTPDGVFDGGLLGIALHPDFADNRFVYVFLTYVDGGGAGGGDRELRNKIMRITESGNRLQEAVTILDGIPASPFTNGGFIKFGPDAKLYAGTGAVSDGSHLPQDPGSLSGKILRINDDGTVPADNPFPGSPVYSLGHRNPQGMAWDGEGNMFVAESGPQKNDEINLVRAGMNYGWPEQQCSGGNGTFVDAVLCYDPTIGPGGILFYTGDRLELRSPFVMASLDAANLYQLDFEEGLGSQESILSGIGRVRDAVEGPDGSIYVITSNTDGKGFPDGDDDRLLRILK